MSFPSIIYGEYGDEKITGSTKLHALGTKMELADGRIFRYARATTAAVVVGKLYTAASSEANTANLNEIVPSGTNAAGARSVNLTIAGTILAADVYDDGYLHIASSVGTGVGHVYKVQSASSCGIGGTSTVTLAGNDELKVALESGTTTVGLRKNEYDAIVILAAATVGINTLVGVPAASIAASSYGWVQRRGPCSVFVSTAAPLIGEGCTASTAVIGAVEKQLGTTGVEKSRMYKPIGYVMTEAASTEYALIDLQLE